MTERELGKYRILEEIGHGGFATVYRAMDTTLEREVALKVLDPLLMRDEPFVARFQQEARAAASLDHPHIVPIYEVGKGEGQLFIAMRLVRGLSLAKRLQTEGRIPWEETLSILRQVSDALAYAHEQGVIHRDIKPQNILLDERSGAMLSDFGFARLVSTSTLTQSVSGGIVGTPAYIPPEIWEGATATPTTDVYALACVVYEMLTGEVLFGGETPMVVMRAHDRGAQLPEEWPIDIPPDVVGILKHALARQPAERYATVLEFLAALEEVQTAVVAERIAAEVARLLDEMRQAMGAGRFEAAVAAGEKLLELQSDHSEGARLLGEAQAKLARQRQLMERLAQERTSLQEARQEFAAEKAGLEELRADREAEEQRIAAELAEAEQRLQELQQASERSAQEKAAIETQFEALKQKADDQNQGAKRLQQAAALLNEGKLEELERLLEHPPEPESRPLPQLAKQAPGRTPEEERERTSEQQAEVQAMALGLLAVLALVFAIASFANEVPGLGVFLLIGAMVLGGAGFAISQRS